MTLDPISFAPYHLMHAPSMHAPLPCISKLAMQTEQFFISKLAKQTLLFSFFNQQISNADFMYVNKNNNNKKSALLICWYRCALLFHCSNL